MLPVLQCLTATDGGTRAPYCLRRSVVASTVWSFCKLVGTVQWDVGWIEPVYAGDMVLLYGTVVKFEETVAVGQNATDVHLVTLGRKGVVLVRGDEQHGSCAQGRTGCLVPVKLSPHSS